MKSLLSIMIIALFSVNLAAQDVKQFLFVGIYENTKRGFCGDYEYITAPVTSYKEYEHRRSQFNSGLASDPKKESKTILVENNEVVIIFSYEKKASGWNCKSNIKSSIKAKSLEDCKKSLEAMVAADPADFATPPKIDFIWPEKK
ncbi:hypothetical protein HYN56_19895 [Flavobacterium crocinum]|uniref:Uncharacterized protein n=1 Tax=Flavobacterium crocinum TaxID=2183896 RepID=A0A2S1YQK6_9FLAO|nr:hypothetical protein [Flavobacterium crocinum]AWK06365.1 hypothetical protein HYN56_19895 [Flavobacterium crocinum]